MAESLELDYLIMQHPKTFVVEKNIVRLQVQSPLTRAMREASGVAIGKYNIACRYLYL